MNIRPHDLVWIDQATALLVENELPIWVTQHWQIKLPLVMRRDKVINNFIPVGVRGMKRSQRLAAIINKSAVVRVISPEKLVAHASTLIPISSLAIPAIQALVLLKGHKLPWAWGVTGSCGYQLATGISVMTQESDLDLLIRCYQPARFDDFVGLAELLKTLPCRVDVQIETPYGGFALNEWLRDRKVMLKTAEGPIVTANPWQLEVSL